jgi:hypothetical protein
MRQDRPNAAKAILAAARLHAVSRTGELLAMQFTQGAEVSPSVPKQHWSTEMKHGRIGDENAMREAPQIRTLISDLDRIVQILNCDIATEEERVRVFDRSDVTYPLFAITLAARRDNLSGTLVVFEQRLATIKAPLVEPIAA